MRVASPRTWLPVALLSIAVALPPLGYAQKKPDAPPPVAD